jgi:pyruvate decarboxylase
VKAAATFLNKAVKPVLVGGVKLRPWSAEKAFLDLADASGYPVAVQPHAKGMFPESHKRFIGRPPRSQKF